MTQALIDRVMMIAAAPTIAGERCNVRFRTPATARIHAATYKRLDGVPEVHISPDLDSDHAMNSYLHELGHIRAGHMASVKATDYNEAPPDSKPLNWETIDWQHEAEADQWRDRWITIGEANRDPDLPRIEGIVTALMKFYSEGGLM
jgi:hypothetical protein